MSDGDNNESPQKEEAAMEQSGEEGLRQVEENKAVSTVESKDVNMDTTDNKEQPAESEDTSTNSAIPKKSSVKRTQKKKLEYEYVDDDQKRLGLLERPVIIESGKREKRKVERLEITVKIAQKEQKKVEVPEGSGEKLGECPRIERQLQKTRGEDLKILHRLLFGRVATPLLIRKNIRQFCGFPFSKEDKEYHKKHMTLTKHTTTVLKKICEVLDLEKSGTKDMIMTRIMEFVLLPKSSGLPVPQKKKRSGKGENKKGVKQKPGKKAKAAAKEESVEVSDSVDSPDEDSEPDEKGDGPDEDEKEDDSEVDDSEEAPKKKKPKVQKTTKKEKTVKETKKEKKVKEKVEKKVKEKKVKQKSEKKKAAPPKKQKVPKEVSDDSSDDDEPLAKKNTSEPPSDEDVKECIKKILEGANLEEVTMKTVLKQVYETYPAFDLSDRKTFIKNTVKQLIS